MFRRLALAATLSLCLAPALAQAADDAPYPATITFLATRNGEPIGTHTLTFADDGQRRTVGVAIDFNVKLAGVTLYRYVHRGRETWQDGHVQSINSTTDDNGALYQVNVRRAGPLLKVERSLRPSGWLPGTTEQNAGSQQHWSDSVGGEMLPTSHWNRRQVQQKTLLNTQSGARAEVRITELGRDSVRTRSRTVQATRYRYAGDLELDHWFDDTGRWVKLSFAARDGSTVEYTLQD